MAKCIKCGEHLILDEESNSYYCEQCNRIYSEEELKKPDDAKVLFLCFVMWIPIVNLFMIPLIQNKPREEKIAYSNVAIVSIFTQVLIGFVLVILLYHSNSSSISSFIAESRRVAENSIYTSNIGDSIPQLPEPEFVVPDEYVEEETVSSYSEELLYILDNSTITGDKVRELINAYPTYGYLLQTTSVRTKYETMNYYINVGLLIKECEYDSVIDYSYITASLTDYFTLNKNKVVGLGNLEDSGKTSYIYDSQRFLVNALYSRNGDCIGLAFTELEE
jgi:hypothetical protein